MTATTTFCFEGYDVHVVFHPERINVPFILKLMAGLKLQTTARSIKMIDKALVRLIASWDVLDDSVDPPVMLPLEVKRLAPLSFPFKTAVFEAIIHSAR